MWLNTKHFTPAYDRLCSVFIAVPMRRAILEPFRRDRIEEKYDDVANKFRRHPKRIYHSLPQIIV